MGRSPASQGKSAETTAAPGMASLRGTATIAAAANGADDTTTTPSIRQIGCKIRRTPGTASSTARIPGSASSASNWQPNPAASQPNSRTSHSRPCGNRTADGTTPRIPA